MNHHEHHHAHENVESEVNTKVTYDNGKVFIKVEDSMGNPPELSVQHEKEMHFMIVSNDLEKYYHLHPTKEQQGLYVVNQELDEGTYQAFVDIAPENKAITLHRIPCKLAQRKRLKLIWVARII